MHVLWAHSRSTSLFLPPISPFCSQMDLLLLTGIRTHMTLRFHQVWGPQMRVNSDPVFLRLPEVFQCDYFQLWLFF